MVDKYIYEGVITGLLVILGFFLKRLVKSIDDMANRFDQLSDRLEDMHADLLENYVRFTHLRDVVLNTETKFDAKMRICQAENRKDAA